MNESKLPVVIHRTRGEMGAAAATQAGEQIRQLLLRQPTINMIFAAAPSQNEFLMALIAEDIDWRRIRAFHMDEYTGLAAEAPQGFGNFLQERLFGQVEFLSVDYINGQAADAAQECDRYARLLTKYPPDIVCMGIGENGHLAFNDPPVADFADPYMVKVVELDTACRRQQVNDGCFDSIDMVPTHAITLTIPALMAGKFIFCMVPGKLKAEAVYNTIHQPVDTAYPSTILRNHDRAILYLDAGSAEKLTL